MYNMQDRIVQILLVWILSDTVAAHDEYSRKQDVCTSSFIVLGVIGAVIMQLLLVVILCVCRNGRRAAKRTILATGADVKSAIQEQQERNSRPKKPKGRWPFVGRLRRGSYSLKDGQKTLHISRASSFRASSRAINNIDLVSLGIMQDSDKPVWGTEAVKEDELYVISYDDEDIRYVQPYKIWIKLHEEEPFERVDFGRDITDVDRQLVRIPMSTITK